MKPKCLAVTSHKGGSHKTTICVNAAAGLGMRGLRVLIIDTDGQKNSSIHAALPDDENPDVTLSTLLSNNKDDAKLKDLTRLAIKETHWENVSIICSDDSIGNVADKLQLTSHMAFSELGKSLNHVASRIDDPVNGFDAIIIDCAPDRRILTTGAIAYATHTLIPILSGSLYGYDGFLDMLNHITSLRKETNPQLVNLGILISGWDGNLLAHKKLLGLVTDRYQDINNVDLVKLFNGRIPRSTKMEQASMLSRSIFEVAEPSSSIYMAYDNFVDQLCVDMGLAVHDKLTHEGV
ncbi:ParA family protein [Iodobacter sp. CM08]|uniref:ParA family protein n=1 Tax=Iodobacter sp. CM08 TaxID=3085902 RepID=UPI002981961D|nr:ParA family protein [Iodobacter sp. CM08]MDW5418632.1 ParA family protein [Iodobacter sp. CM08]